MALLVATVAMFMNLKQEFVPTLNEGSWTAMVYQPANTSLKTSLERCIKTQKYLIEKLDRRIRQRDCEIRAHRSERVVATLELAPR